MRRTVAARKGVPETACYRALALQELGRNAEAQRLLHELLKSTGEMLRTRASVDYFATSLPEMLVFDDDLPCRHRVAARFLQAQAELALGQVTRARRRLVQVLAMDASHARRRTF